MAGGGFAGIKTLKLPAAVLYTPSGSATTSRLITEW